MTNMQAMTPPTYHFLHIVGVLLLFVGFGGIAGGDNASRRKAMMYHGLGLLVILVSGFGFIAKSKMSYTAPFVLVMYAVFLALGALPVLAKRGVMSPKIAVKLALLLGVIAAYCGYFKVPA
jgi:hypothetical protein